MQLMGIAEFIVGRAFARPVGPPIPRASLSTVFAVSMIASNDVRCPSQSRHHLEITKLQLLPLSGQHHASGRSQWMAIYLEMEAGNNDDRTRQVPEFDDKAVHRLGCNPALHRGDLHLLRTGATRSHRRHPRRSRREFGRVSKASSTA